MGTKKERIRGAPQLFPGGLCLILSLVFLHTIPLWAEAMAITSNVIHRTFHIGWRNSTGTAFAIDQASRQYLLTARHVVDGIESGNVIKLRHEGEWKDLAVQVVGIGKGEADVAILACSILLAPPHQLPASDKEIIYGQAVSFLGYPFGWDAGSEQINRGIPIPFVKGGILSAMVFGDVTKFFLDAHGNKGFSGGPLVFVPMGRKETELHVAGIISHYPNPRMSWQPIVDPNGKSLTNPAGESIGYIQENPGIVVAIGIRHALELIEANPIGFQLTADKDNSGR